MSSTPLTCCSSGVATRLLDGQRVGAGVGAGDDDLRRHDVGELRDRQRAASTTRPREDGDDRDDDRDDRTADEEGSHVLASAAACGGRGAAVAGGCSARRRQRDDSGRVFDAPCPAASCGASTTTRAPGSSPLATIQRLPDAAPSVTLTTATLLCPVRPRAPAPPPCSSRHRALRHQQRVVRHAASRRCTRPYWPGRSRCAGLGKVALMRIVPVRGSICRSAARNVPRESDTRCRRRATAAGRVPVFQRPCGGDG